MNEALYVAASGMETVQRMLDTSAHNAVNNRSPGFQRHEIIARSFGAFLDDAGGRENLIGGKEVVIFDQGELRPTDHPYALALQGDGFFAIEDDRGNTHYTRNGQFTLDGQGQISAAGGYPLKGEGGPIVVDPNGGDVIIEPTGVVIQAGAEIGRISVFDFTREEKSRFEKTGETFFKAPEGATPTLAETTEVRQSHIEVPSFGMKGTVKMLVASKNFDAMQRTIRTINEIQQQLIRSVQ